MIRQDFRFIGFDGRAAEFRSGDWIARIHALEPTLWKVLLYPNGAEPPPSMSVAPDLDEYDPRPRNRIEPLGWTFPDPVCRPGADGVSLSTDRLRVEVKLPEFRLSWSMKSAGVWHPLFSDRATQAYNLDGLQGDGACHYLARQAGDRHFGLGEKAGDVIKTGGRYRMRAVDCMGYDAASSDPLYKHLPYYLTSAEHGWYAIYYDTPAECEIDLGRELDNYHGLYQYFRSDAPYLDYYVLAGAAPAEIVPAFARMGGRPAFPPRWSLGYLASSMAYTDSPDAQEMLGRFLDRCRYEGIPLSGFHLSSGYTNVGGKRCVFRWDRERFPDPAALFARFHADGVRIIANIKPCLLADHPLYAECAEAGRFVVGPDGKPQPAQFWDGLGAYLDFTRPAAAAWWREMVSTQLLGYGVDATWNDNNEYEIWDRGARCAGLGAETAAVALRPVQTLLMLSASRSAQLSQLPDQRPYLVSRSGCHGMQRYAQTWTGDNYTAWKTLRYNHRMGMGLSLSGVYNFGHDVGGFSGPRPGPELFARWVQHGIFMPRFSIHSWKDDGGSNEPWMYPELTETIRRLIRLRYRLLPFLYDLLYRSHRWYEPIVAPVFYHFPDGADPESDLYMLGRDLLVANVFDPGVERLEVELPSGAGWYELRTGRRRAGGARVECPAGITDPPAMFVRDGGVLAFDPGAPEASGRWLRLLAFAPERGESRRELFLDDGASRAYRDGVFALPSLGQLAEPSCLRLTFRSPGAERFCERVEAAAIDAWDRPQVWDGSGSGGSGPARFDPGAGAAGFPAGLWG